ncbi:MAG: glycosyltransferase [Candidatus Omnitrophica bacterium]|nr:glycosyltransferase [Candidatus Omnitrophota bacterium]
MLLKGADVKFLTGYKTSQDTRVIPSYGLLNGLLSQGMSFVDKLPLLMFPNRKKIIFSPSIIPVKLSKLINKLSPDIVHLNWITRGFIKIEDLLNIKAPIVWTLHDSWAFTGGCHLPSECTKYKESCGACPELGSDNEKDLSNWIWQRKAKTYKKLRLQIVTPSKWLSNCVKASSLFYNYDVKIIPNGLDISLYRSLGRELSKQRLGLSGSKKLVLLGAMGLDRDFNKGLQFLKDLLRIISKRSIDNIEFIIIGTKKREKRICEGIQLNFFGTIRNELDMISLYSSADITLLLSLQENLPYLCMESLSCGTPVVAFDVGGVSDMVKHAENGYLAKPFELEEIVNGISWILEGEERYIELSNNARINCESNFSSELISSRYLDLYKEVVS